MQSSGALFITTALVSIIGIRPHIAAQPMPRPSAERCDAQLEAPTFES